MIDWRWLASIGAALLTTACVRASTPAVHSPTPALQFTDAPWPTALPDDEGVSSDGLAALGPWLESHTTGTPTSTALFRRGRLIWQHNAGGATENSLWHIESPAITATIVGHEPRLLEKVQQPLVNWVPPAAWPQGLHRQSTLAHLLSGTSGFHSADEPGADWDYDEWAFALVPSLLRARPDAAPSLSHAACHSLAMRLGARSWRCEETSQGFGYSVRSSLQDLARVGELWLQGGVFRGQRLLPEKFVADALSDQSRPEDSFFGYGWFLRDARRDKSFPAGLFYHVSAGPDGTSTLLVVVPGWQMVAAVGADTRKWDFTKDADIPPPAIARFWMGELPKVIASPSVR
ncbi:MAG: hypothetical protein SF187_05940 [Deltaproteobacteria bacterium]|nr:hypothetical protein [Deltaproteobacteria bacterium]